MLRCGGLGEGEHGEVDGGGQRLREERHEPGAHQLRHLLGQARGKASAPVVLFLRSATGWFLCI